ncbi:MAG: double-strand break repair helicase AddA [Proteobacteria bacterium]|nr:double-strand break repair helicase AddA [Pseudomonadota bacterium]
MRTDPILPESEKLRRIEATAPGIDAWVSANAGSGKTTILGNRVIRLLLEGTAPDRILCLTFTKAAAAEMQGRIFRQLAGWVALDDAALSQAIGRLETLSTHSAPIDPARLRRARTLFARAIETPGGLKIQTIHAFAERILHLFPLEAGLPIDFDVLTEADAATMLEAARRATIDVATREAASPLGLAFGELVEAASLDSFARALEEALGILGRLAGRGEALPAPDAREATCRRYFDVPPGESEARIEADFERAILSANALAEAIEAVAAQKKPSNKQLALAGKLAAILRLRRAGRHWQEKLRRLLLTKDGDIAKPALFVADVVKAAPWLAQEETRLREALAEYQLRLRAFRAFTRSQALTLVAEDVFRRFRAAKRARNVLDFDDLIAALRRLLVGGQANWVQMKLDAAIEHILVDEAQDTTPEMWDIIKALADEFFAGEGASRSKRSLFVVGDEKQSIYSFQGADPAVFEETRRHFAARAPDARFLVKPVDLNYSFRSSSDVLGAVDRVFAPEAHRAGLTASGQEVHHIAARQRFPGHVELWPLLRPGAVAEGEKPLRATTLLANRIAATVGGWLRNGETHLSDGQPITPGDILILVRQRGPFFSAILRALGNARIPVAGADRLRLQEEIAIHDLLAIAQAAILGEDDLALACALKTPLFGLDEPGLERLARGRAGSLRAALMESDDPAIRPLAARFRILSERVHAFTPFAFFSALLTEPAAGAPHMSGRKAMLSRLGPDAGDPLDAFLGEARNFSQQTPGAILPFLVEQSRHVSTLKRDMEQSADQVRVMTVHGAKGLEARIVFLADMGETPPRQKEAGAILLKGEAPVIAWTGNRREEPAAMKSVRAGERVKLMSEYRRLFYVAMTRASDRLYLCGHGRKLGKDGIEKPPPEDRLEWSWHQLALTAFEGYAQPVEEADGAIIRRILSDVPAAPAAPRESGREKPPAPNAPAWLRTKLVPAPAEPAPPLLPSRRLARQDLARGEQGHGFARRRGVILHQLFELLPRVESQARASAGHALLASLAPELAHAERETLLAPVLARMDSPEGRRIFGPNARAEVAIAGEIALPDGRRRAVSGRIDRLVTGTEAVTILDMKTGRMRRRDPAILRQMALYRAVIAAIYPEKPVSCQILWTESGILEQLDPLDLDEALARVTGE